MTESVSRETIEVINTQSDLVIGKHPSNQLISLAKISLQHKYNEYVIFSCIQKYINIQNYMIPNVKYNNTVLFIKYKYIYNTHK